MKKKRNYDLIKGEILMNLQELNGVSFFDARDLHRIISIKQPFRIWITLKIKKWEYTPGDDYSKHIKMERKGKELIETRNYFISLSMASELCLAESENNKKAMMAHGVIREIKRNSTLQFSHEEFKEELTNMIYKNNEVIKICPF